MPKFPRLDSESEIVFRTFRREPAEESPETSLQLRVEQLSAIEQTYHYYQKCQTDRNLTPSFLWNAKPRFGKTFAAYSFASRIQASKILIVTNRPAIIDSWYSDFRKFDFEDYGKVKNLSDNNFRWIFTSSIAAKKRLGSAHRIYTRSEQLRNPKLIQKNFIHFISLQDIKGGDLDGFKRKNSWIFNLGKNGSDGWDLVIIDESHEGIDTAKAAQVFAQVKSSFTLYLSGTPFKTLADKKFSKSQIFNWTYADEQEQKFKWSNPEVTNPYAELPEMQIVTYTSPKLTQPANLGASDVELNLSELFKVVRTNAGDKFLYEEHVRDFIRSLSDPESQYPFSQHNSLESLRHTFWLLPGVKACEQFKKLLLEDEFFQAHFRPEDIILAAGHGDDDRITQTALSEVQERIGERPLDTRTITLSCGQLTGGITIPAWTAVFMLNNSKSPSLYMQSAFRAQNPFRVVKNDETHIKDQCFVFDFTPARTLEMLAQIADMSYADTALSREQKVRRFLKYLPVFAEKENGELERLTPCDILTIPEQLITAEVVSRGFMSNRLFKNVSGIFSCPPEIRKIISKLDEAKTNSNVERNAKRKTEITTLPRIWVDRNQLIHINEDITLSATHGLFGAQKYAEAESTDAEEINFLLNEAVIRARQAGYSVEAALKVKEALARKLPKIVKTLPKYQDYEKELPDSATTRTKTAEDKVRDRLRGFARTIPILLMAYGMPDTCLENFGENIPDNIFEELTGITKDDFCKLRDGLDYETTDDKGCKYLAHFDGFFDEKVFNQAVQEFYAQKHKLAKYYQSDVSNDIFNFIPPQFTNQTFTPRTVVKMMLDKLENYQPGIFVSTTHKFLDPYMKSGMFITEIAKRIFAQTRARYHSDHECIKHILESQVYGLAPTPILTAITNNYIFGFDQKGNINRQNFCEFDITKSVKQRKFTNKIREIFNLGEDMKFTAIVGNPPYQENLSKTTDQAQGNTSWIYHYFQRSADQLADYTCLIYPFGSWFDSPNRMGKFGQQILSDNHTVLINAFEGTTDRRAWYRSDREPQPIFGQNTDLSAGVAVVLRGLTKLSSYFQFSNRMYSDEEIKVSHNEAMELTANPAFFNISRKLAGPKLSNRIKKNLFGIESNFVERNPAKVSLSSDDWSKPILLLANDKSGPTGRVQRYWTDEKYLPKGHEYLDLYKVVMLSAYPKKTFIAGKPTIENIQNRADELIELLPRGSSFGRSRFALFMSKNKKECENFLKYAKTQFFAALLLQEPNRSTSFGSVILDQDFSDQSDINWNLSIDEIDRILCEKYKLTSREQKVLGIKLK